MAIYFPSAVTCKEGKQVIVELTVDDREHLDAGKLPCPCCGRPCRPYVRFEPGAASAISWTGTTWASSDDQPATLRSVGLVE